MKQVFGYIRVSTPKQGEKGVSLQEQRGAIERFCRTRGFDVGEWFEERETAAKRGRPIFNQMLKALKAGKATGVVIHKIDRSARNLRDWADLGELIDQGTDVWFANESLDLNTRGGRLTADIQAVVAADYIRNLREETRKGFYGRLKQGIYPRPAPLGYLDQGAGQPKAIDPVKGPLVRLGFDLYASGRYNLDQLTEEMTKRGLRNTRNRSVQRARWALMLRDPFYVGVILIHSTGESFPGAHVPLVPKPTFDRVQAILDGRYHPRNFRHWFAFRRLLACSLCQATMIGERQKGHVYYRCHTSACPTRCVREEAVDYAVRAELFKLELEPLEEVRARQAIEKLKADWKQNTESAQKGLRLRISNIEQRLARLTDAYLDQVLDKEAFDNRNRLLLLEKKDLEQQLGAPEKMAAVPDHVLNVLELAKTAYSSYEMANEEEKHCLVETLTSNRLVSAENVILKLKEPYDLIADRRNYLGGGRRETRTLTALRPYAPEAYAYTSSAIRPSRISNLLNLQRVSAG